MYFALNTPHTSQKRWQILALSIVLSYVIMTFGFCFTLCVVSSRLALETRDKSYVLPGTNATVPVDEWPYHLRTDVVITSTCTILYLVFSVSSVCYIAQSTRRYVPFTFHLVWLLFPFVACANGVGQYHRLDEASRVLWDTVSPDFRNLFYLECEVLGVTAVALLGFLASFHPQVKHFFEADHN